MKYLAVILTYISFYFHPLLYQIPQRNISNALISLHLILLLVVMQRFLVNLGGLTLAALRKNRPADTILRTGIGILVFTASLFILGMSGLWHRPLLLGLVLVCELFCLYRGTPLLPKFPAVFRQLRGHRILTALLGIIVIAKLSHTLSANWDWDTVWYHLPSVDDWFKAGGFYYEDFAPLYMFATNADVLKVFGLITFGTEKKIALHLFGQMLHFGYGSLLSAWICFTILGKLKVRPVFMVFAFLTPLTGDYFVDWGARGKIDIIYCSFILLVLYAAWLYSNFRRPEYLIYGAAFLGLVVGSRYFGFFICVPFGAVFLYWLFKQKSLKLWPVAAGAFLAGGVWLYLRNFIYTNNPVFPFFPEAFPGVDIDGERIKYILPYFGTFVDKAIDSTFIQGTLLGSVFQFPFNYGAILVPLLWHQTRLRFTAVVVVLYFGTLLAFGLNNFYPRYSFFISFIVLIWAVASLDKLYTMIAGRFTNVGVHLPRIALASVTILVLAFSHLDLDIRGIFTGPQFLGGGSKMKTYGTKKKWAFQHKIFRWAGKNLPEGTILLGLSDPQRYYSKHKVAIATRGIRTRRIFESQTSLTEKFTALKELGISHVYANAKERKALVADGKLHKPGEFAAWHKECPGVYEFKKTKLCSL